jgi:hypothetical protein
MLPLMFVSRNREKLLNAIIFFVRKTKHCHTLKLFKLLNFLDFEHYRQTGRTVTGLDYRALPKGPVPTTLLRELNRGGDPDLLQAIALFPIKDEITDALMRRDLKPKKAFDSTVFTPRELEIMERLADFFMELRAEDMSEFSHKQKMPWSSVFEGGKGQGKEISPDLVFKAEPIMHEKPAIDLEELQFRRDLLKEIQ